MLRELRRQQAALEGLADGRALRVQAGVVEGEGGPAGEVLGQFQDLLAEVLVGGLAEGQHADDAVAGDQGQDDGLAADRGGRGQGAGRCPRRPARSGRRPRPRLRMEAAQRRLVGGLGGGRPDAGAGRGDRVGRGDLGEQRLDAVDAFLVLVQDVGRGTGRRPGRRSCRRRTRWPASARSSGPSGPGSGRGPGCRRAGRRPRRGRTASRGAGVPARRGGRDSTASAMRSAANWRRRASSLE